MPEPEAPQTSLDNTQLFNLGLLLILALSLFVLVSLFINKEKLSHDEGAMVKHPDSFENVSLVAHAAIVYDIVNKKVVFAKNPDETLPLASVTKILTAVTATELLPVSAVVTVKKEFIDAEGDSGLRTNEHWKLSDLIDFSLMVSSNDGAAAIAAAAGAFETQSDPSAITEQDFIVDMNKKSQTLGMLNSHFYNESGLDVSTTQSGGYASAHDIATLFAYTLEKHPDIFAATRYQSLPFTSLDNILHIAKNTDTILADIPGILGSKTGYTDLAGGNLGVVFDPGITRPFAVIVLGSTYDGRFDDVKTLVNRTLAYVSAGN